MLLFHLCVCVCVFCLGFGGRGSAALDHSFPTLRRVDSTKVIVGSSAAQQRCHCYNGMQ